MLLFESVVLICSKQEKIIQFYFSFKIKQKRQKVPVFKLWSGWWIRFTHMLFLTNIWRFVINITAERRSVKAEPWLPSAVVFDLPSLNAHFHQSVFFFLMWWCSLLLMCMWTDSLCDVTAVWMWWKRDAPTDAPKGNSFKSIYLNISSFKELNDLFLCYITMEPLKEKQKPQTA